MAAMDNSKRAADGTTHRLPQLQAGQSNQSKFKLSEMRCEDEDGDDNDDDYDDGQSSSTSSSTTLMKVIVIMIHNS